MKFFMIGPYYLNWHYTQGLLELIKNLWNFIVFEFHFFSVKDLLLTLLSPFQRLKEDYGNNAIDFQKILSALVVNIIMRIVGFFVRSFILICALISIVLSFLLFPIIIIGWIILPFIIVILLTGSVWAYLKYRI
ncbi:MAG: hypothetical protein RLZZ517_600 [Candidatus Parcubacteria bacterium]